MKRPEFYLLCLFSCLLVGCSGRHRNESQAAVSVEPGLGVLGICELGMTMSDLREHIDDFRLISWSPQPSFSKSLFGVVPSLGAILYLEKEKPLHLIEFRVTPYDSEVIHGLKITHPFRGKIKDSVTFTDKGVTKDEITHYHGQIDLIAVSYVDENTHKGEAFRIMFPNNEEELWYLKQGIKFKIKSGVVVSFSVFPRRNVEKQGENKGLVPKNGLE